MIRYIALLHQRDDPARAAASQELAHTILARQEGWRALANTYGLRVLICQAGSADLPVTRLGDDDGLVLGWLFCNGAEKQGGPGRLDRDTSARIAATEGEHLLAKFWGNYVAFWRDARSETLHVMRDPCGALPCHVATLGGVTVAFSSVEDVAGLPGFPTGIDWDFIRSFIVSNYFATPHTGLEGVRELRPGERLTLAKRADPEVDLAWNPVTIARRPSRQTFNEASDELSALGLTCAGAWGRSYGKLVVRLSGGLDSSILVNLLTRGSAAEVTAMHLASPLAGDREAAMAKLAAAQAGAELVSVIYDPDAVDLRNAMTGARLIRPTKQIIGRHADSLAQELCAARGANALVAGHGGDTLFLQRAGAEHMFADYLRLNGVGRAFWSVAYTTAMQLEAPITEILARGFRSVLSGRSAAAYPFLASPAWRTQRLISAAAIDAIPAEHLERPWFSEARRLPRGKAEHLLAIASLHHYHSAQLSAFQRDTLLPFLSQPIVEFCLRTPIYLFGWGGRDRTLQRKAFKDLLPDAIVRRTDKGLVDASLLRMLLRNLPFLRELILDGVVLDQGWFDRNRVERALTQEHLLRGAAIEDIYNLIAAEIWAQAWVNKAPI